MKVQNPTGQPVYATVEGTAYEVLPGQSVEVASPRTAMLLAEYGLTVDRSAVDAGLLELRDDATVEDVQTPFSMHGPGTDVRGNIVDEEAAAAFAASVDGDTSKTAARHAAATTSTVVAPEPSGETVTSASSSRKRSSSSSD